MPRTPRNLPPGVNCRLSALLGRWASAHTLSAQRVDAIRQTIVALPPALGFDWWWNLLDPVHGSAFRHIPGWSASPPVPSASVVLPPSALDRDHSAGYQPYLRLT